MTKHRFLDKAAIFAAQDQKIEEIEVPEWGGWLRVKSITAVERDVFEGEITRTNGKNRSINARNVRAKLVAATVVDEAGKNLFSLSDVEMLGQKSAKAMDRVFGKASELAGMREADIEELAANFNETPADA